MRMVQGTDVSILEVIGTNLFFQEYSRILDFFYHLPH